MLKNNSSVSACSLSSCRLKAEALARALNSRIWPCTWVGGEPSGGDGMSAPDEEDDLYFDASPSPIEDEDSITRYPRNDDSSAASVAGRAKLYELLQQHVADDATEVFYDVSEDGHFDRSKARGGNVSRG
ncbi:uncharacterized protein LOC129217087 [Uloborus diversus]|uniref:uncharacterized protein LOC129217087 n=1 Tax=Uloborus diversus TaxID=327109 RepID=UPI002409DAC4|nr:uncharacterized protein LOC129217087 [Uloborus diversus]